MARLRTINEAYAHLKQQEHALRHHGDLYVRTAAGWPRIAIRDGRLAIGSVNAAPFGLPGEVDLSGLSTCGLEA